jgi:hypothetical protein
MEFNWVFIGLNMILKCVVNFHRPSEGNCISNYIRSRYFGSLFKRKSIFEQTQSPSVATGSLSVNVKHAGIKQSDNPSNSLITYQTD